MTIAPAPQPSRAARIYKSAAGGVLLLAGLGFAWGLIHSWRRAQVTRAWVETPCVIRASGIELQRTGGANAPAQWRPQVEYVYQWRERTFTGMRIRRVEGPSPHRERAESKAARYPAGMRTHCYVDPADPSSAVLEHASGAALYSLWWPLLFALGGGGMIWSAWARRAGSAPRDCGTA